MLEIIHTSFSYPNSSHSSINDINLSLDAGKILGLLGANGAGKTTLVSLIVGIRKPGSGQILIDGTKAREGRCDIGIVPQDFAFYDRLTVAENLQFFADLLYPDKRKSRQAVEQAIANCHLQTVLKSHAEKCSGGEKRRLNIALTLLREQKLLILDEPTANVDPVSRELILSLLKTLNKAGTTIIYTSHLLSEVESLCDEFAILQNGLLKLRGSKAEIFAGQSTRLVATIKPASARPTPPAHLPIQSLTERQLVLQHNLSDRDAIATVATLQSMGYEFSSIHFSHGSLDEIFKQLQRDQEQQVA